jgi:hypothetical protein
MVAAAAAAVVVVAVTTIAATVTNVATMTEVVMAAVTTTEATNAATATRAMAETATAEVAARTVTAILLVEVPVARATSVVVIDTSAEVTETLREAVTQLPVLEELAMASLPLDPRRATPMEAPPTEASSKRIDGVHHDLTERSVTAILPLLLSSTNTSAFLAQLHLLICHLFVAFFMFMDYSRLNQALLTQEFSVICDS